MRGLLLKDLKATIKGYAFILFLAFGMMIFIKDELGAYAQFYTGSIAAALIADDERSQWTRISAMMPYSKSSIAISKFIISDGILFSMFLTHFISAIVSLYCFNQEINYQLLSYFYLVTNVLIVGNSLNIPILLKMGTEKGRFIMTLTLGTAFMIMTASQALIEMFGYENQIILNIIFSIISIITTIISIKITTNIYKNCKMYY